MRRKGILILALAAGAMLVVGVSLAGAVNRYPTKIHPAGWSGDATDAIVYGDLHTKAKCLGPRLMQLSKKTDSGFKVVDQDYSSAHGAWAFEGNIGPLPGKLRIEVSKVRLRHHKGVCLDDSVTIPVSPPPPPA